MRIASRFRITLFALVAGVVGAAACHAQESNQQPGAATAEPAAPVRRATFSLEAVAVGDLPVVGGATRELSVAPGDVLTVEVYLRDWSAKGEKLRAYQAAFDEVSYKSGSTGTIKPFQFDQTTAKSLENMENAIINDDHPKYIFRNSRNRLPMVDTMTWGYRWMNVLVNPVEAIVAPQDGTKFYCGTLRMQASDDASGTFVLKLLEDPSDSMLRDETNENKAILPVDFERLKVHVVPGAGGLRVAKSDPPSGAIDARLPTMREGGLVGWDRVTLTFTSDTTAIQPGDFEVIDGSASPPRIKQLTSNGSTLTVMLDRAVRPGEWTTITHSASRTGVRFGSLPGDVNADRVVDHRDVLRVLEGPALETSGPVAQLDVDGDGEFKLADALRIVDILADPRNRYRPRLPD